MYLWLKAFHIIFLVAWFAGLFYIFRLFVYHVKFKDQQNRTKAYEMMEYKLLYWISHPAMTLTIFSGILMIIDNPALMKLGWLHFKLACVALLIGYQIFAGITRRKFSEGNYFLSETACRIINEVPTILLIAIVLLAVLKP
ncbi:MAG: protoporphyrinogen oxidase HemJ [Deltaproteobacteria bacterium]|nr:protoporphyrinogen oxidase HemJ [Deltaproteobacteria bacterium]